MLALARAHPDLIVPGAPKIGFITVGALAEAMGVARKHVNDICNQSRAATAPTALMLARVNANASSGRDR